MLHDRLLTLAGFSAENTSVGQFHHLAEIHRQLRLIFSKVSDSHQSVIVQRVASEILQFLATFVEEILSIERSILNQELSIVGANGIVALARLSALLSPWCPILEYFHRLASPLTNGVDLLNRLRHDKDTGNRDLGEIIATLLVRAEETWLSLMAEIVLEGNSENPDWFVKEEMIVDALVPDCISKETASTILLIGCTVTRLQHLSSNLESKHLQIISEIQCPIAAHDIKRAIDRIQNSIHQNMLQNIFSKENVIHLLEDIKRTMLLADAQFATGLVEQALVERESCDTIEQRHIDSVMTHFPDDSGLRVRLLLSNKKLSLFQDLLLGVDVHIECQLLWPVDLILTQTEIDEYNILWFFITAVRIARSRIHGIWLERSRLSREVCGSIAFVNFFLDCLWGYIQIDVIECSYTDFFAKIGSTDSYEPSMVKREHSTLLNSLLGNLFQRSNNDSQLLRTILADIEFFARDNGSNGAAVKQSIELLVHNAAKFSDDLVKIDMLLMRLDGGFWFTKRKTQNPFAKNE
ncbi:Gamma-tubulin complex component 4 [Neolecta irregularis DAH-3]|uniref:Spindle pole body component n=1 Tax=Neolecta irregularis (strain DAH-3) TaxID=1198029 RepID=A0A1U7LPQ6_NEOID|nr:Gamma-tubulin complex component 4 [Neolecta irregularis DAH-3]|eukprot:OLL24637.1 Gamma-tubulin complex component 4 [Neolecta irregularis DAH-3]